MPKQLVQTANLSHGHAAGLGPLSMTVVAVLGLAFLLAEGAVLSVPGVHGIAYALVAVFAASTVSSIAGFAFSALCGALLFHLMDSPVYAVQVMIVCSIAIQLLSIAALWRAIDWRSLGIFVFGGIIGAPAGVYLLLHLPTTTYRTIIGGLLIVYGGYLLLRLPIRALQMGPLWDACAGFLGGITGGLAGFPGAFVTIWCGLKGWDKARQRGVYQPFILVMQPVTLLAIHLMRPSSSTQLQLDWNATEKRLGALLLQGEGLVSIDNCEQPLGGQFLCQMLTQPSARTRILGKSEAPDLPTNALVTATGNNLRLVGDATRRAVLCRLDPGVERPETRLFDKDPVAHAKAFRPQLVVAAITILKAYDNAGRPGGTTPLGSFKDWSRRVRDALIWLGAADPVASLEEVRSLDPQLEAISVVIAQIDQELFGKTFTVPELIKLATETRTPPGLFKIAPSDFKRPELREALLTVAGRTNRISGHVLGRWLAGQKGRIVGGLCIEQVETRQGYAVWEITGPPAP